MNFKKRVNGSWVDTPHYIMGTDTDTITTLPADLYADGNNATVGLKGNMYQASGVSPDSTVMPQGTGERTGNLLDYTTVESTTNATATQISGGISVSGRYYVRFRTVEFTVGSAYTMSWKANTIGGTSAPSWRFHYADNTYSSMPSSGGFLVVEKEVSELLLYVSTSANCVVEFTEIMLNSGSTALPYENFGYKIPISSANTTTPVYLGEVESTRQIKKYEFTGTENISSNTLGVSKVGFTIAISDMLSNGRKNGYCTHFVAQNSPSGSSLDGITYGASDKVLYVTFSVATATAYNLTDVTSVKTWLSQQYANGTPVTIWYVLATPETAVVNEPIRKIGVYADEVSGITIPVTAGANTLSVDTTLQPSEVTINYKGWHPVTDVHECTNGAWT